MDATSDNQNEAPHLRGVLDCRRQQIPYGPGENVPC